MKSKRLFALDLIKIMATCLIIFHHYQQIIGGWFEGHINFYGGIISYGYLVELFFMISGFLSVHSISNAISSNESFAHYFNKKYMRFFPVCAITAVVSYIVEIISFIVYEKYTLGKVDLWGMIESVFMIQSVGIFPGSYVNSPSWYISVLLLCYIWHYLIVWTCNKLDIGNNKFFVLMIAVGLSIQTYKIEFAFFNAATARGYIAFFIGVLLESVFYENKHKNRYVDFVLSNRFFSIILISFPFVIIRLIYFFGAGDWYMNVLIFFAWPFFIMFAVNDRVKRLFNWKIIEVMSSISFYAYIWHYSLLLCWRLIHDKYLSMINIESYITMLCFMIIAWIWGIIWYWCFDKITDYLSKIVKK
jgi:peptidoglycan/LPS O-acetylase OafA/YrhL